MQRTFFSFLLPPLRLQIQNHTNHFQMKHRLHLICRQMNLGYFRLFSLSPDILNNIFLLSPSLSERFFGVSSATNLPLFIIITLSQTALISLNICELKITVFLFLSSLITFLYFDNLLRIKTNCRFCQV